MIPYADTNFFTNRLFDLAHNRVVVILLELHEKNCYPPLPVTWLLRLELTNALQRVVFELRHGSQHFRATPESVMIAEADFLNDLETGVLAAERSLEMAQLIRGFDRLSYRHTAKHGFRTYDILHVASALLLGCDTFWSFDALGSVVISGDQCSFFFIPKT